MKFSYLYRILTLTLLIGILSCNQGAPPEEGKDQVPSDTVTEPAKTSGLTRDYQSKQVKGCDGGSGSAAAAKTALLANDFATCNREASCAYNASVQGPGSQGDPEAAFYGLLCKLALSVESPQMEQLAMEPLKASDYFGQVDGVTNLLKKFELKMTENGLITFHAYLETQAGLGRDVDAVFQTALDFVLENFFDIHVLARRLANAPDFKASIPIEFLGVDASAAADLQDWSDLQMGFVDFWAMNALGIAELFKIYQTGIDSLDSFTDVAQIAADMNADPKFLSLRSGHPDTANFKSAFAAWSEAAVQAGGNFGTRWNSSTNQFDVPQWIRDSEMFPLNKQIEPFALGVLAAQLRRSLNNELVWLSASDNEIAFNVGGILESLPDSATVPGSPIKYQMGGDFELDGTFMKALLGNNFAER